MLTCPNCGGENDPDRGACSGCGIDLDAVRLVAEEREGGELLAIALRRRIGNLENAIDLIDAALTVPAAEYVPAIADAFRIIDSVRTVERSNGRTDLPKKGRGEGHASPDARVSDAKGEQHDRLAVGGFDVMVSAAVPGGAVFIAKDRDAAVRLVQTLAAAQRAGVNINTARDGALVMRSAFPDLPADALRFADAVSKDERQPRNDPRPCPPKAHGDRRDDRRPPKPRPPHDKRPPPSARPRR